MKIFLSLFALCLLAPFSAQAQFIIKDSVYFTLDDGIQTPEEMMEESVYLHEWCQNNSYQSLYFNCDCLAAAFLKEREKLGPLVPQAQIMNDLTKSAKAVCGNTEAIAGNIFRDCMTYADISRELEPDNEEYCSCAANKTARDFTKRPRLNIRYIRNVRVDALLYCEEPRNRPAPASSQPKNGSWLSSSPTP